MIQPIEVEESNKAMIDLADNRAPSIDESTFKGNDQYYPKLKQLLIITISEAKESNWRTFPSLTATRIFLSQKTVRDLI